MADLNKKEDDMRTINEQLNDIIEGIKTPAEIIAEGVHDYAISHYSPQSYDEGDAYRALRALYVKPPEKWVKVDEEFDWEKGEDDEA